MSQKVISGVVLFDSCRTRVAGLADVPEISIGRGYCTGKELTGIIVLFKRKRKKIKLPEAVS